MICATVLLLVRGGFAAAGAATPRSMTRTNTTVAA
jgi:hypothetical protein